MLLHCLNQFKSIYILLQAQEAQMPLQGGMQLNCFIIKTDEVQNKFLEVIL